MNGAEAIVTAAKEAGIEVCFANPGTTELPLVAALDTVGGIRSHLGLFEGVCTGAADGYGRMKGRPAMALLHLGPGLANGLANLHNARRGHTPLVVVVGEHATWHKGLDPPLAMDIASLAGSVAGWQRSCGSSANLFRAMKEAAAAAALGQVAVLIVPYDLQQRPARRSAGLRPPQGQEAAPEGLIEEAALLLRARGGEAAILLGGRITEEVLAEAARVRRACGCDLLAETFPARIERGAGLPEVRRLPYLAEAAAGLLSRYEAFVLAGAGEPVSFFGYEGGPGALIGWEKERCVLTAPGGDAALDLRRLADALDAPAAVPLAEGPLCRPPVPTGVLNERSIPQVVAALQPPGAIVVDEGITTSASYYSLTSSLAPFTLLTLTGGSLGAGAPMAVGAAVACPERPVINLLADGAAMYTIQALWTQAREGLNVKTLICANRRYAILHLEAHRLGMSGSAEAARRLMNLEGIDWVSLGKGFGVESCRVATAEGLAAALEQALADSGPFLIEMAMG